MSEKFTSNQIETANLDHNQEEPQVADAILQLGHVAAFDLQTNVPLQGARKPRLDNGEKRTRSGTKYSTPDSEVVRDIKRDTAGKVSYFPAADVKPEGAEALGRGEVAFNREVMEHLCVELLEKYPDRTLALRAIMTSVNGVQKGAGRDGGDIIDIVDTVRLGIEKPGEVFNVAVMGTDPKLASMDVHRVSQYAAQVGFARKFELTEEQANSIFPAVLVFDTAGLQKAGRNVWGVSFREDVDPNQVLLEARILDCME